MEKYTVLSPWAENDYMVTQPICGRPETLNGRTVGLFSSFKEYHPYFMREVEMQLKDRFPEAEFSHYLYPVETVEIQNDPDYYPGFLQWLAGVDIVVGVGADAGSCALYMGYIFAQIEKLGKPTVLYTYYRYENSARQGCAARAVPSLRMINTYSEVHIPETEKNVEKWVHSNFGPDIEASLDKLIEAMTVPLTDEEAFPEQKPDYANAMFEGTLEELNAVFYERGWTNGTPIVPPTRELVDEMLKGTDLPADYVVGCLPPRMGKATVEKIAVNAAMAGCLPTYMPVLIAAVRGMLDPCIHLEGWTCSNAGWAPMLFINGPIRKELSINSGRNLLSPYYRAQACISRAFAYLIMNISGVRPGLEDMSGMGHENRFAACIAENEEASPWGPLQTDFGFDADTSTITLFWPCEHVQMRTESVDSVLASMTSLSFNGFDAGCAFIINPETAKRLADEGFDKQKLKDYVVEYTRRPSTQVGRFVMGNNHPPKVVMPRGGKVYSTRQFWSDEHMLITVAGCDWVMAYIGGGDHGGPSCTKIELPEAWDALIEQYKDKAPDYIR